MSKSKYDYELFSQCRARVKMIKLAQEQHQSRVQNHLVEDLKAFWNYVRSKRSCKIKKQILKNGEVLSGKQCEEFAQYFHSVYRTEQANLSVTEAIIAAGDTNAAARVHIESLSLQDVQRALQKLKSKRSKGNAGSQVDEYRPVAVLSSVAKLFESAMYERIFVKVNQQLSEAQHGFRPMRSTTSNLLSYMTEVVPAVHRGCR